METTENVKQNNGTLIGSEESEEDEEISSEFCQESPRINVTDNEEGDTEMPNTAIESHLSSKTTTPTPTTDCHSHLQYLHQNPNSPKSSDISLFSLNLFSPSISNSLADEVAANTQPNLDDLKQLERDKNTVYSHPLFPLLALLFEKCEIATSSISSFDTDPSLTSFNTEIEEFIQHQQSSGKSFFTNNPEVDSLMIRAIQVFRIHLLELEKVSELCKDFCQRYISCLRTKMRSDVLLRGTGDNNSDDLMKSDLLDNFSETNQQLNETSSTFLSLSASSLSSSGSSSALCPSPQGIICPSPPSPSLSTSSHRSSNPHSNHTPDLDLSSLKSPMSPYLGISFNQVINPYYKFSIPKYNLLNVNFTEDNSQTIEDQNEDNMVVHDLSLKKASDISPSDNVSVSNLNRCNNSLTTTPVVSPNNLDDTSDIPTLKQVKTSQAKSRKTYLEKGSTGSHSKRGVLPKQATSIMRSWLFQHIVHPYPTEDEKRAIASETNLTLLQVNNWFINARRRILQPMLDSANSVHSELVTNNSSETQELDLSSKNTKTGTNSVHSKKLKTNSNQLNRFWPQSLANIIQTSDLKTKT